jgi:hypothetical protein
MEIFSLEMLLQKVLPSNALSKNACAVPLVASGSRQFGDHKLLGNY